MPQGHGVGDAKTLEGALDQCSLSIMRPDDVPGPVAVAEARSIENDDPIVLGGQIDQTTGFEILDHAAVAVQKDQRLARAPFDVAQPNTVHLKELTGRRIVALRSAQ